MVYDFLVKYESESITLGAIFPSQMYKELIDVSLHLWQSTARCSSMFGQ